MSLTNGGRMAQIPVKDKTFEKLMKIKASSVEVMEGKNVSWDEVILSMCDTVIANEDFYKLFVKNNFQAKRRKNGQGKINTDSGRHEDNNSFVRQVGNQ